MSKDAFRIALALLVTAVLGLGGYMIAERSPKAAPQQTQKLSPDEFAATVLVQHFLKVCDSLHVGHPNRPSESSCRAMRQ
jgi:hypothetical protein